MDSIRNLVDQPESSEDQDALKRMRATAIGDYTKARRQVVRLGNEIEVLDFEIDDAEDFIRHLKQSLSDFDDSSVTFFALGHLAFEYCPSCFAPVEPKHADHCQLCNARRLGGGDDSRTLAVRLDLQMQLKESEALQVDRHAERTQKSAQLRVARQALRRATATIELADAGTVTGRESAIAELSRKTGFIDSELEGLQKRLELAKQIKTSSEAKEDLNSRVTRLKAEIEAITRSQGTRKREAFTLISTRTKALLDKDLQEHSDFGEVDNVSFEFSGDWIAINGDKNRAGSASGMVILKNSFAAGMLDAAFLDQRFNLPRWMLFDNIEDKGMVEERSWNFQRLLVVMSQAATVTHQIIFTTSKIAPELDRSELVVGRRYERAARSLN